MNTKQQTIKMVAFNPETRHYEEITPESEVAIAEVTPLFWVASANTWVSIPGVDAANVYDEWMAQMDPEGPAVKCPHCNSTDLRDHGDAGEGWEGYTCHICSNFFTVKRA